MYPESKESSLLEQLLAERAISDLVESALELWLPLAEAAVLQAAAPPPDPSAAADQDAQWDYLVDALILYGVGIIAADAYSKAYTVMTGVPLAAAKAILAVPYPSMPGMPDREAMAKRAGAILQRRLGIDVTSVERMLTANPNVAAFVKQHTSNVKQRVIDAVARVFKRTRKITDTAETPEAAREEVAGVFDPLDPQWRAAADETGRTAGTGTLNAALEQAARDTGRKLEIAWVAILDTHTRIAHAEADGQRRAPGVAFDVGGEPLRFPGDPLGDLDNIINCRCRLFAYFTSPPPDLTASLELSVEDGEWIIAAAEFKNWIEQCGGLPSYIKRITKHLQENGMDQSRAIATAVDAAKKMCKTGDTNFPGKQNVNPGSRAEACTAVAQWEKLKACAAKKRAEKAASINRAAEWAAAMDGAPYVYGNSHASEKVASMTDYRSFTSVLAVIGTPTDDGRMFANDIKLGFRDFPLPLLWQKQSAGGHYDAFTVGVIESAGVVGNEVIGKGYLLNTPEADEAATQIEHGVTGPSVDLGDVQWELRDKNGVPVTEEDYYANPDMEMVQTVLAAKVLAATLVATPAFGQTSIVLGAHVEKGDAALVAAAAMVTDEVAPVYESALFANPNFDGPTLPHITEGGRIQGHLAAFNVCHIGIQDACVIAPRSQTEYAWFHTAPPVKTESGPVKVGRLTVGGGHAGPKLGPGPTIAHYDNAGTCFALVHVGEDEFGIWFSGVAAPGATPEQVAQGLSAPLSGDWRNVGGNLELVAALAVNTPGFPIIASGATDDDDNPLALVASLGPCAGEAKTELARTSEADQIALAKHIVNEWRASERRDAEAKALITGEVRRQAAAIIEGAS